MAQLTIVGLGPGDPELLTRKADRILRESRRLILRTDRHETAEYLRREGIDFISLDYLYDQAEDFDEIEKLSAACVRKALSEGDVTYAVPGQGLLGDGTVQRLLGMRIRIEMVPGVSQTDEALSLAGKNVKEAADALTQLPASLVRADLLFPHLPLMVTQLDDPLQTGEAKLALQSAYGDDAQGVLISCGKARKLALEELDRVNGLDHRSCFYLPGKTEDARYDFSDLLDVMDTLRRQCPWDRVQTHESLRPYLVEECCEVMETIDRDDPEHLCEELGDLLYQVVFHACVSEGMGDFDIRDVTDAICRKMISRHPAIYGDGEAEEDWEKMKAVQRGHHTREEKLLSVARTLPSLMWAQKLMKYGDWTEDEEACRKKLEALTRAYAQGEDCAGEWLWTAVLWMKLKDENAEIRLHDYCRSVVREAERKAGDEKNA